MSSGFTKAELLQAIHQNKFVSEWVAVTECRVNANSGNANIKDLRVTPGAKAQIDSFMSDYSAMMDLTAPKNISVSSLTSQIVRAKVADGTKMATFDCRYFSRRREAERQESSKFDHMANKVSKFFARSTQLEVLEIVYSFICQVVELLPDADTRKMAPDDVDELSNFRREAGWGAFSKAHQVGVFQRELSRINGRADTWKNAINALEALLHIAGDECGMLVLDRRDLIDCNSKNNSRHHEARVNDLTSVLGQTFPPAHRFLMTRENEKYMSWFQSRLDDESNCWSPPEHFTLFPREQGPRDEGVLLSDMARLRID